MWYDEDNRARNTQGRETRGQWLIIRQRRYVGVVKQQEHAPLRDKRICRRMFSITVRSSALCTLYYRQSSASIGAIEYFERQTDVTTAALFFTATFAYSSKYAWTKVGQRLHANTPKCRRHIGIPLSGRTWPSAINMATLVRIMLRYAVGTSSYARHMRCRRRHGGG